MTRQRRETLHGGRYWTAWLAATVAMLALGVGSMMVGAVPTNSGFNIRDHGAVGDGVTLDTVAVNHAVAACAQAGGGQVLFPPGHYLSGTVHLRSHVTLFLEAGATLVGTTNLAEYQHPAPPDFMAGARWGNWHRGLIVGENVEDVAIVGPGIIDGNKVFDPAGEERMRGPHAIVLANCRGITLRDISVRDAGNYAFFFLVSDQVEVRNVKFTGGWDGVHFRGAPGHDCHDVNIIGCQFYTGDDSIAGSYWNNVVISGCVINSSCNGIRLIGPATRLIIHDCLVYGPGAQPHRTSGAARRTNMLSGIILQPGAWEPMPGPLDDVLISDITMRDVASPVTLWTRQGNPTGRITVERLNATGVYRAATSVESWGDTPLANIVFRDVNLEFTGGGHAEASPQTVKRPGVDCRPLPAWGFYARNVEKLTLEDVRFGTAADDLRPVVLADTVKQFNLDHVRFPQVSGGRELIVTTNVGAANVRETALPSANR